MIFNAKLEFIPDDWQLINGSKVLVLYSGMRPLKYVTDNPSDIPSLGGENIDQSGTLKFKNIRYISRAYYQKMKDGKIEAQDILINKDGANTGKIAYVSQKPFEDCAVNEHVFIIRNTGEFKQQFLFYFLFSNYGNNQITRKIVGSAQGGINNSFIKGLWIPKPPKLEQKAIATILSKVDEAIDTVKQSINATKNLKKAMIQNLLTGKLKPDGTWRTEEEFYIHEKFGRIPNGWKCTRFKDVSVLQRGKDLTDNNVKKGIYPVVKSNGVQIYHNEYFIEPPGIVTGRSGTIGKVFYIDEKFWAHNTTLYIKDFKNNFPKYIYYLIKRMDFRQYYAGTTVPTLNRNDIHKLKVTVPNSFDEQKTIVDVLELYETILNKKIKKIKSLEQLKKSLMQNLLTGKTRLSNEAIEKINQN
ncbi:restriction endonuclease subunit S [Myroides odoratimimus]|uniref:restriction endonuclease subunit S n=1 Tax=Myroides odoratimimus TaxID=76832 RepID=UPI002578661B|nr:restriction endonuclease subunit S [Myroides odoratimimus]MDM1094902.1 restriction endonuclease subunit S [Myroides odoratimimus]